MERRIRSFMASHGFTGFAPFLSALGQDKVLFDAFFKHLTINVTQFFRDTTQWNNLRELVLPKLIQNSLALKLWSAGCSSGQEPYSLAITMSEYFPRTRFRFWLPISTST